MTKLYIVYGSETKLLEKLFLKKDVFYIRIYNKKEPKYLKNSVNVNSVEKFKFEFKKIFDQKN